MKTKLLAVALFGFASLHGQQAKNIIKTNVTGYIFRNVNLSYERSINKTFAINVGFGMMPKGDVPMVKNFIGEDADNEIQDLKVSSTSFTIEPRIYLGTKYNSGFYFAPYYRYTKIKADQIQYEFSYTKDDNSERDMTLDMSGDISANSVGLMIGSQWYFGKNKNWVIDWWIVGGHYGVSKGNIIGISKNPLDAEDQAAINEELNDLDIPIIDYKAEVNSNGAKVKVDGPWAGLRSGLSFGYRF